MKIIKPVQNLIDEFRKLPTIGPKSAARLVYYLLRAPEEESLQLARAIENLKRKTTVCEKCFNVAEHNPCQICNDESRQSGLLCVVEEPLDIMALESTGKYNGVYHVLGGTIDPIAGIGPEELRIKELMDRLEFGLVKEVILATNPTLEGEATAMYIKKDIERLGEISSSFKVTRIARGLPTGGDLEYADKITLTRALEGRRDF